MTKSRGIQRPRWPWTPDQDALMRSQYPDTLTRDLAALIGCTESQLFVRAKKLGLHKSAAFMSGPMARLLDGHRDNGNRFQKGHKPWCAGTKGLVGTQAGCKATQFKKGELTGRNAASYIPVGGHRINSDGYLDRKLRDDGPPQKRFERVHRLVWIETHGPIPEGHLIVFRNGRRTTVLEEITVDRLECITKEEHAAHMCGPEELMQIHRLRGQITRQINKRLKGATA